MYSLQQIIILYAHSSGPIQTCLYANVERKWSKWILPKLIVSQRDRQDDTLACFNILQVILKKVNIRQNLPKSHPNTWFSSDITVLIIKMCKIWRSAQLLQISKLQEKRRIFLTSLTEINKTPFNYLLNLNCLLCSFFMWADVFVLSDTQHEGSSFVLQTQMEAHRS